LRDVRDGVLTRGAAERTYGVVIGADGKSVDEARTRGLRSHSNRPQYPG
jgi:hypothetical protein